MPPPQGGASGSVAGAAATAAGDETLESHGHVLGTAVAVNPLDLARLADNPIKAKWNMGIHSAQ